MKKFVIPDNSVQQITAQFTELLRAIISEAVEARLATATPEKKIIGIAEACERYRISRATIGRLVKSGELKVTQIRGRKFLSISEIEGRA